jgi:hypothetical protein
MDVIYGHSGFSFFDVWSLVHFCFWVFIASAIWAWGSRHPSNTWWRFLSIFGCVGLAYCWEGIESFLAPRFPTHWADWFTYYRYEFYALCPKYAEGCHYESWWNSWVSDPLTCLGGMLLTYWLLDHRRK